MNIELIRDHCISKPDATESFPFDDDTLVFKVNGKIFAMVNLYGETRLNLKCDPELAIELREKYMAVQPGYHMNKRHWNTIAIDGSTPDALILDWIDHSYNCACLNKGKRKLGGRKKD